MKSLSDWLPTGKPKTAIHFYNRALEQYQQQNWSACVQLLTRCLSIDANFTDAHYNMACAYQQLDDLDNAKQHLQQVLALKPEDMDASYNLGLLLLNQEQWADAYPLFELVCAATPDDATALVGLGLCHLGMGEPDKAQSVFEDALTLQPDLPAAHFQLAKCLMHANPSTPDAVQQVLDHYHQALPAFAENVSLHLDISLLAAKLSQWPLAMEHALTCVTLDPNHSKGYNQLGLSLYCQDQYDEAIVHFQNALALDASYHTVYNNLTFAYEKNGQLDDALNALNMYLDTLDDPDERAATETHMRDLLKKGAKP